jgi:hypothetical protein
MERILSELPAGLASSVMIGDKKWIRHTAANPNADIKLIMRELSRVLSLAKE